VNRITPPAAPSAAQGSSARVRLAHIPSAGTVAAALVAAALLAFGVAFAVGRVLSESAGSTSGQSSPGQTAQLRLADAARVASVRPLAGARSTPALRGLSKAAPLPELRPAPARPVAPPPRREPRAPTEVQVATAPVLEASFSEPQPTVRVAVARPARRPKPVRKPKRPRRKAPVVIVGEG
jgi:hypothetical protein